MSIGFAFAIEELPLVFFTTLAPTGVVCVMLICFLQLTMHFSNEQRKSMDRNFWVPLVITTAGLVASAAHLGTPANALYVFMGFGRSPLSNEVVAMIAFLAIASLYWLIAFSLRKLTVVRRIGQVALIVMGLVALLAIAFAYNVPSIVTWHLPCVPALLICGSMSAGCALGYYIIRISHIEPTGHVAKRVVIGMGAIFFAVEIALCFIYLAMLAEMHGAYGTALQIAQGAYFLVAFHVLCGIVTFALLVFDYRRGNKSRERSVTVRAGNAEGPSALEKWASIPFAATVIYLVGFLAFRFAFYMLHMTSGLAA